MVALAAAVVVTLPKMALAQLIKAMRVDKDLQVQLLVLAAAVAQGQ
jgi:hypothetical protein